jgi:transposase
MVLLRERVHPRGLSFKTQGKIFMKKSILKRPWRQIAKEVFNEEGKRPYWKVVSAALRELTQRKGRPKGDNYHKCGRKRVMTTALCDWLVASLKRLRVKSECTSFDLQRLMAKEQGVVMEASSIRRALNDAGYKYLPPMIARGPAPALWG